MKPITVLMTILLMAAGAHAQEIITNTEPATVAWDANSESDLAGYKLHVSNEADETKLIDVGNVTEYQLEAVNLFADQVSEIRVTAYDTGGLESDFSNSVFFYHETPPAAPQNHHIVGELEASYDGGDTWEAVYAFGPLPMREQPQNAMYRFHGRIREGEAQREFELVDLTASAATEMPPLPEPLGQ